MKLTSNTLKKMIKEEMEKLLLNEALTNLVRFPNQNGWELYSSLVAEAYANAPVYEERAKPHFDALAPFYDKMFKRITRKRIQPRPVDYHPYDVGGGVEDTSTVHRLRKDFEETGGIDVSTVDSEHPILSPEENVRARVVHDYMSHIQPKHPAGFTSPTEPGSIIEEIRAYNIHLKTIPRIAVPALFTEVLGQVCHYYSKGQFIEQKVALLEGFDYFNPGIVYPSTGYKNEGRILVPINK